LLIALLTLAADWAFSSSERLLLPEGIRRLRPEEIKAAASVS
jgi:hypothetical protein